jgi:hypothetical protein
MTGHKPVGWAGNVLRVGRAVGWVGVSPTDRNLAVGCAAMAAGDNVTAMPVFTAIRSAP